jgi:hypothetical protein
LWFERLRCLFSLILFLQDLEAMVTSGSLKAKLNIESPSGATYEIVSFSTPPYRKASPRLMCSGFSFSQTNKCARWL